MDPTVVIGGHLKNISTNARFGDGDFLIAEADESDRSFLHLQASLAVVTNISLEHLDVYKDLDDIKETFKQFLNNLPFYGKAIVCIDDPNVRSLLPINHLKIVKYGLEERADFYATDLVLHPNHSTFTVWHHTAEKPLGPVHLNMPGRHNVLNALAAIALAHDLEVPFEVISNALHSFKGVERRFSFKGLYHGAEIFDDYGHHPKEIEATLLVAKNRSKKDLIVLFQPHRFTRTHKLWDQFIDMFMRNNTIKHLIITDVHAASEAPIPEITSQNLVKALQQKNPSFCVSYAPLESDFKSIANLLEKIVAPDDLILLQGAGKINKFADKLS